MKHLLYTTIGFSSEYCKLLELFLQSLEVYSKTKYDIAILCDVDLAGQVKEISAKFPCFTFLYLDQPKAKSPHEASMNKLSIFDLPNINDYTNVLYIDLDCLFFVEPDIFLEQELERGILYCAEDGFVHKIVNPHQSMYYSLQHYTGAELIMFEKNKILPFNAGFFMFQNTSKMREHFQNIRTMIATWTKPFFYEQSFMNVYFNLRFTTCRNTTLIKPSEYIMFPDMNVKSEGAILHFCGHPGDGKIKYDLMNTYWKKFGDQKK
jgi:lipopolysaccharide biosynthesis glycosyltransferase